MKTLRWVEVNIFRIKATGSRGKELSRKTKKGPIKICNIHHIYCLAYCLANLFLGILESPKCQIAHFSSTGHSGDSPGGISTTSNISLQSRRAWSCLKHGLNNFILSALTSILSVLFCFCGCFLADVWEKAEVSLFLV